MGSYSSCGAQRAAVSRKGSFQALSPLQPSADNVILVCISAICHKGIWSFYSGVATCLIKEFLIMTEKRKLSTRNRGEPPMKKRQSTPPPPPPQPPVDPVEESLPAKLKDGQPLPIVPEQQASDLSTKDFQSIAERFILGKITENEIC